MKLLKLCTAALALCAISACASMPEANGELAQASSTASNMVQADTVEEVLTENVNVPPYVILLLMAASTFVPNPFELVGRMFKMLFGGVLELWKLFRGS